MKFWFALCSMRKSNEFGNEALLDKDSSLSSDQERDTNLGSYRAQELVV